MKYGCLGVWGTSAQPRRLSNPKFLSRTNAPSLYKHSCESFSWYSQYCFEGFTRQLEMMKVPFVLVPFAMTVIWTVSPLENLRFCFKESAWFQNVLLNNNNGPTGLRLTSGASGSSSTSDFSSGIAASGTARAYGPKSFVSHLWRLVTPHYLQKLFRRRGLGRGRPVPESTLCVPVIYFLGLVRGAKLLRLWIVFSLDSLVEVLHI